ncbi:tRNA(Glu)-specific nuclease WapA precursor [Sporotomaculum syntrophicum]|uniref:tRNA(Glu)-specific nuclease WapA n=1 Tax=Sporotomaculum syntrophicum TaxID=182264 RepID=A0A9D2WM19_9FIRM|nr:RHS repeat domain-containing protein [Sporotomaculum syntrophicum]KAF1083693.1 tRNA(Glu)-specific nuclease WapA precursor [Sporotomaculum syntrophicum]
MAQNNELPAGQNSGAATALTDVDKIAGLTEPISAELDNILSNNNVQEVLNETMPKGQTSPNATHATEQRESSEAHQTESINENSYQEQNETATGTIEPQQDKSVSRETYRAMSPESLAALITPESEAYYNLILGPSVTNGVNNVQYSAWADTDEIVSAQTGDLTIKQTDIKLPGRNGLDLNISRIYQSNQALWGDRRFDPDGDGLVAGYTDYSTYYQNRYNLGLGWSFGFPSVQVEKIRYKDGENEYDRAERYYHTGDGSVYHVGSSTYNERTPSGLDNYYVDDAVFKVLGAGDFRFNNGQVTSEFSFTTPDKTVQYFAGDGRLLGIVDRFGNTITFKHTEMPVTNRTPNNDFEIDYDYGLWATEQKPFVERPRLDEDDHYYFDTSSGKDDTTSLKFSANIQTASSAFSRDIPVLPNTKYYLSGYIKDQLTSGNVQLGYHLYTNNETFTPISGASGYASPSNKNNWELVEFAIQTPADAKYIRLEFKNNGKGTSRLDKVRFDRAWPLISEITDSIGRTVTFDYTDTLYEDYQGNGPHSAGTIIVTVNDPAKTKNYTITYSKSQIEQIYDFYNGCFTNDRVGTPNKMVWEELRRYPVLSSYKYTYNNEDIYNSYNYDTQEQTFYYYPSNTNDVITTYSSLLNELYLRNSKTTYNYENADKDLGDFGEYQVSRITQRYENKKTAEEAYSSHQYYHRTYQYPNNFSSKMLQDNGLSINYTFKSKVAADGRFHDGLVLATEEKKCDNGNGNVDVEAINYQEYHTTFLDQPTKIKIEQYNERNTSNVNTLYQGYTYNNWGGIATETVQLTPAQWNNPTEKSRHTTSYTYHPDYKFITAQSYYQTPELLLTESTSYDSLGRVVTATNAKGETTNYQYGDASHPGNHTRINIQHSDGRTTRTDYNYAGAYYAFPSTITSYYTEEGVQKTSATHKSYEFIRGNVTSETDALGNTTGYSYDTQGRLKKTTHLQSTGQDGNYVVEDNTNYYYFVNLCEPLVETPQYTFCVYNYSTRNGSMFKCTYSYYDDHGNLLLSQYWDYAQGGYAPSVYGYDNYSQLAWCKDANGNKTTYQSDGWGRLQKVTDPQGNKYSIEHDIFNRTKTTIFAPSDTGVAENHYVETSDQWGRTISIKGYPNGPGGAAVEEKYAYDLAGNPTKQTDPNNNSTQYSYDALSQLTKVTNPLGEITDYDYDRLGDLTQIQQYQGATPIPTVKQYSERGALVAKQPPAGQPTTYKYNANGLPVEIKDASGKITTLEYYQDSRPAQKRANRDRIQYYYHPLGVLEKYQPVNDATGNGEALTYSYYIFTGFVKTRADVGFEYNLLGNKSKTTDPFGLSTNYQYNNLNRLTTVTADGKNYTYEYYGDGMVKAVNYPQLTGGTSIRTEYTYDNINRLKTMHNKLGSQTITQYSYTYDNNGNITSVTENGQTTNYTYDALNRLTGVQRPGGEQLSYQYDSRGNRTAASPNDSGLDGFIPGEFSYNNWDQLATFTTGGQTSNYSYDPEGLRTKKVTPSGTTRYHYDNTGRVIAESNAGDSVTAQMIWGNQALARKVDGSYYYYLYNGHGDVTKVVDQNGNIVNSYTYDEWGNILSQQEQLPQPLKYAGEYYDDESGLYYLRARYYDPTVGRFISKDSDEGEINNPLSLNLYTYCENDPVNNVDPSGHNPVILGLYAYASKVLTSPDTQNDLRLISIDIQKKDYLAAGLDTIGLLVPAGTGFGELSKPVQEGVVWLSKQLGKSVDEVLKMVGKGAGKADIQVVNKGMNNLRVLKDTKIKSYNVSLDLERGGSGLTNIHLKVNNTKYFFDDTKGAFIDQAGNRLPNSLKGNQTIIDALKKAQDKVNSGW